MNVTGIINDVEISETDVQTFFIDEFDVTHTDYDILVKENRTVTVTGNNMKGTSQSVSYVYVDKDVTVSGKGWSEKEDGVTFSVSSFSISLKEGWNAICGTMTMSGNIITETGSMSISVAASDPSSTKWVLDEWDSGGYFSMIPAFDNFLNSKKALRSSRLAR